MKFRRIQVKETIDRRYLGALRFVDRVTARMLERPLRLSGRGLKFFANRSFFHVISQAAGLESHQDAFKEPPDTPDPRDLDFSLTVKDPSGEYLDRLFAFKLPRNPDPKAAHSLFTPIDVAMFAAPAVRLSPNWSVIRASIYDVDDPEAEIPVPGALLRVRDTEDRLLMSGLSDPRGEAAVIIPGIPVTRFSSGTAPDADSEPAPGEEDEDWLASGDVIETQTAATLEIIVAPETPWPVDPGELEDNRLTWRKQFRAADGDALEDELVLALKTGKTHPLKLFVKLT